MTCMNSFDAGPLASEYGGINYRNQITELVEPIESVILDLFQLIVVGAR